MTPFAPGTTTVIEHALVDEPLLSLEALADAADRLDPKHVTHRRADVPRLSPERRHTTLADPPGEVVRGIATNHCWIMLGSLATLPEYTELLRRSVGRFELMLRARGEQILAEDLQAFIAAPGTTVPIHFDRDHHLLMQIHGSKTVGTGTFVDPRVAQLQIERGMGPDRLRADVHPEHCDEHTLQPGEALLMAAYTFHWVENGDEVSIALTCMARTESTAREAAVHQFNLRARRLGLRPAPPGKRPRVDRAKQRAMAARSPWRSKAGTVGTDQEALHDRDAPSN